MSQSEFEQERFPSVEALLRELQERSDDFESVTIQVANGIHIVGPEGQKHFCRDAGAFIRMCDGSSRIIHREDMETLLNDGVLQRMKIPVVLLPLFRPDS